MKKLAILFCLAAGTIQLTAAQTTFTGKVTDRKGGAIPGARVSAWKGTENTLTELDGTFRLDTEERPKQLVVDYVGMASQRVRTKSDELNIRMFPANRRCYYQGEAFVGFGLSISTQVQDMIVSEYPPEWDHPEYDPNARALTRASDNDAYYGDYSLVSVGTVHGIRFTRALFLGGGIELDYLFGQGGHYEIAFPVFGNLRAYLPFSKSVSMFASGNLGYTVGREETQGLYFGLQLGVQYRAFYLSGGIENLNVGARNEVAFARFRLGYNF